MATLTRQEITKSLETYKRRRDALLHGNEAELTHNLKRFAEFCDSDQLIQEVMRAPLTLYHPELDPWWEKVSQSASRRRREPEFEFGANADEELAMQYALIKEVISGRRDVWSYGMLFEHSHLDEARQSFLSVVVHPFCEELTSRVREAANIASPELREYQAVPLERIPNENEIKIFLSHKSVDKPRVERYQKVLQELGYSPWLDEPEMPAGTNLERGILQGMKQSCAAVFFITENFTDERFLASEIDYAIHQKRDKGEKFAIISLCFSNSVKVPELLEPYVHRVVTDDLNGLYEIVRALPVELGGVRWKKRVIPQ